ncbi:hypothetical protein LTR94_028914, partial [Friedmanniomyces endolithicus]
YDDAVAAREQAAAELAEARANLRRRRIDLGFSRVTAPITGRIGPANVTEGALVTAADATPLATIQQIDRVYVDVRQPASGTAAGSPLESGEVTRLTAGHGIAIGGGKGVVLQATAVVQPDWPSDLRDFRNVPLRDLLAEANRYADRPLVLTEPQLGDLRVSGIFRVREPARLAANLAELLDLSLMESPAGIALGRRCDPREKNS